MAKRHGKVLIFLDEIDSLAGSREEEQNKGSRQALTQILIGL